MHSAPATPELAAPAPPGGPGVDGIGERATELSFVRPLIGFPDSLHYVLRPLDGPTGHFATLSSIEQDGLVFLVVAVRAVFPGYVVELPAEERSALDLEADATIDILGLVTRRPGGAPVVNLCAPVVVNPRGGRAVQVVLDESPDDLAVALSLAGSRAPTD